jgi:toxin ParE1/3/4
MRRYRLARPAKADLDRIWFHIARNASIDAADRFIDTITGRFPFLAGSPEAGAARDSIEPGLRVFPVENYLIYYRPTARRGILISRIIHGMRDQQKAWEGDA